MVIGSNKTNVQFNCLHLQFGEQLHFKWVNRWVLYLKVSGSLHVEMLLFSQLVRVLVSPTNPPGATSSCQKAMFHCGLLQQLCTILMATGVPADILTEVRGANRCGHGSTRWGKAGACRGSGLLRAQTKMRAFARKMFQMPELSPSLRDILQYC